MKFININIEKWRKRTKNVYCKWGMILQNAAKTSKMYFHFLRKRLTRFFNL